MVSLVDAVGLAALVVGNTAIAALLTRFFRVRLKTRWGGFVYALSLTPFVLLVTTLFVSGILKIGPNLGSAGAVVGITILVPLGTGMTFDYFWMPTPEEVDLPERYQTDRQPRRERFE